MMLQMFVQTTAVRFIHVSLGSDKLEREKQNIKLQVHTLKGLIKEQ